MTESKYRLYFQEDFFQLDSDDGEHEVFTGKYILGLGFTFLPDPLYFPY